MRALMTNGFVQKCIINPLKDQFNVCLVGSIAGPDGRSYHDIDICVIYKTSNEIDQFKRQLETMGWKKNIPISELNGDMTGDVWVSKIETPLGVCEIRLDVYYSEYLLVA